MSTECQVPEAGDAIGGLSLAGSESRVEIGGRDCGVGACRDAFHDTVEMERWRWGRDG